MWLMAALFRMVTVVRSTAAFFSETGCDGVYLVIYIYTDLITLVTDKKLHKRSDRTFYRQSAPPLRLYVGRQALISRHYLHAGIGVTYGQYWTRAAISAMWTCESTCYVVLLCWYNFNYSLFRRIIIANVLMKSK